MGILFVDGACDLEFNWGWELVCRSIDIKEFTLEKQKISVVSVWKHAAEFVCDLQKG